MSNEQKIEKLRSEIQASRLLEDHEKADWLNLLELMNDKQIGELEEILQAPAKTAAPAPSMPTLSHISNLPTQMGGTGARSKPAPTPAPQPASPRPAQMPVRPSQPAVTPGVATRPKITSRSGGEGAAQERGRTQPAEFSNIEDVDNLDLEQFRRIDPDSIPAALHPLVLHYGYFPVLAHLESSKLFESYLSTGKKLLSGTPLEPHFNLTQAEFETMTDILQAIRLNKS